MSNSSLTGIPVLDETELERVAGGQETPNKGSTQTETWGQWFRNRASGAIMRVMPLISGEPNPERIEGPKPEPQRVERTVPTTRGGGPARGGGTFGVRRPDRKEQPALLTT